LISARDERLCTSREISGMRLHACLSVNTRIHECVEGWPCLVYSVVLRSMSGSRSTRFHFAVLVLSTVATAAAAQTRPMRDTAVVSHELAAARDAARIPLFLELAELRREEPAVALRLADSALALLALHPSVLLEARARTKRSAALEAQSSYPDALAEAQRAESLARSANADSMLIESGYAVARAEWRMGRYPTALAKAKSVYVRQAPRGNSTALARTLNLIGGIQYAQGDLGLALEQFLAALHVSETIGDEQSAARSHNNIGLIYWDLKRHEEALAALKRALAIHDRLGPPSSLANTLNNIGLVLIELKRPNEAIPYLERTLAMDRATGDRFGQAKALSNLGWAKRDLEEDERAADFHRQALAIREAIGDQDGIIRSQGALAELAMDRGDARAAVALLEQSTTLARKINDRLDLVEQLEALSNARAKLGDSAGAFTTFRQLHDLKMALSDSTAQQHISDLETRYRTEQLQRERASAEALAEAHRREVSWLLVGSGLLAACLVLLSVFYLMRGRAQRALAESEQRYRALFQSSVIPTFLIDPETRRVLDLNDPARVMCGRPATPGSLAIDELEPEWIRRALGQALESGTGEQLALDHDWTDDSGQLRQTEIRGSAVALGGRACRLISVRDTTAVRAQEEARQREEKLRSLGVLAGGIAHDFNNALTSILGHVALAKEAEVSEQAELLDFAEQAAVGASRLTVQLLAFAKGGQPLRRPTNVGRLLRDAVSLAGAGSHLGIDLEIPADLWPAMVDNGQFSQVVSNLVINAKQATSQGGRLLVRASNVHDIAVAGTGQTDQRMVRIDFIDNGVGIPAAIRDRVFEPYFTTKSNGSGLGLATAFAICHNHGGRLTCESREGEGTTFSAYFPASSEAAPEPVAAQPGTTPDGVGRILVLEDEPLVQNFLRRMLSQWGYTVEVVGDGRLAVERYVEQMRGGTPFDCLIMDLTIPGGMGGKQAMAEILRHDPRARAIVASGYSDDPTIAHYHEAGFAAALAKPFLPADLARALKTVKAGARGSA
jgi:signal transduction histidine kinase/CheY-like chemotaxis protein/Tfp pilus assembly protein PilF